MKNVCCNRVGQKVVERNTARQRDRQIELYLNISLSKSNDVKMNSTISPKMVAHKDGWLSITKSAIYEVCFTCNLQKISVACVARFLCSSWAACSWSTCGAGAQLHEQTDRQTDGETYSRIDRPSSVTGASCRRWRCGLASRRSHGWRLNVLRRNCRHTD